VKVMLLPDSEKFPRLPTAKFISYEALSMKLEIDTFTYGMVMFAGKFRDASCY